MLCNLLFFAGLFLIGDSLNLDLIFSECNNDPCGCGESNLNCIESTCHVDSGCNQCRSGYFKLDYNYKCVLCDDVYDDGHCLFCQDFHGCGQCEQGYDRVFNQELGVWYCSGAMNQVEPSITRQLPDISTFSGVYVYDDPQYLMDDDTINPPTDLNDELAEDIFNQAQTILVDTTTGIQYKTSYSLELLDQLLELDNNMTIDNETLCDEYDNECLNGNIEDEPDTENDCGPLSYLNEIRRLVILGADTRFEITGSPPIFNPQRYVGQLTFNSGSWCTATLIGPNVILTAGHCVHSGGVGGDWYGNFRFYPRRTRFYTPSSYTISSIRSWAGWTVFRDFNWDIAVLRLNVANTGLGWLRIGRSPSNHVKSNEMIFSRGYPGDKASIPGYYGSMWATSGRIFRAYQHRVYTHTTDTWGGWSGGPFFQYRNSPIQYAVHSGANQLGWFWWKRTVNRHTRINSLKYRLICDFIDNNNVCPRICIPIRFLWWTIGQRCFYL